MLNLPIKYNLTFLFFAILFLHSSSSLAQKNAILLIGDGMGPTVVTATRIHFKGADGKLFLDTAPHIGLVTTYSKDSVVTDSAAAATAMATGQKVNNRALSLVPPYTKDPNGVLQGKKLKTILEMAAENGMSVGLVTNVEITHATPAAFYAHVSNRWDTAQILTDLVKSPVDLILGGGGGYKERPDILSKFRVVTKMKKLKCNLKKPLLGSFFGGSFPYIADVKNKRPRRGALKKLVEFAIDCLSKNEKGYFLMIEAGRIDKALHKRKICHTLYEMAEMDEITKAVVNRVNRKNTLVLATADHDTGGLAINGDLVRGRKLFNEKPCWKGEVAKTYKNSSPGHHFEILRLSTDNLYPEFMASNSAGQKGFVDSSHTAHDVGLWAWGMGAEKVRGFKDNTFIFTLLKEALLDGK